MKNEAEEPLEDIGEDTRNPMEKLPGESEEAYSAFLWFCSLPKGIRDFPEEEMLEELWRRLPLTEQKRFEEAFEKEEYEKSVEESKKYNWEERAQAWDEYQEKKKRKKKGKKR